MRARAIALLALGLTLMWGSASGAATADRARSQLARIRARIAQTRQAELLAKARASRDYARFAQAERLYQASTLRAEAAGTRLQALRSQMGAVRRRLWRERRVLAHRRRLLAATLVGVQEGSVLGSLASLLQARSLGQFLVRLYLFEQVLKLEDRRIAAAAAAYRQVHATLNVVRRQVAEQQAELATVTAAAAQLRQEGAAARQALLHDRALVAADASGLDRLEEAASALVAAIEAQRGASRTQDPAKALAGIHFIWPVVGPITSPFGWRLDPVMHQWWLHTGVDIGVPEGTPVHAAAAGVVLVAGWETGYGNTVVIDDGNGISTLYAHASEILVHVGEQVAQGQVITLAGMTGWATGPHLHFEIRVNGNPINPLPYLPGG